MNEEYELPDDLPTPPELEPDPIIPDFPDEGHRSDEFIGDAVSDTVEPPPPPPPPEDGEAD